MVDNNYLLNPQLDGGIYVFSFSFIKYKWGREDVRKFSKPIRRDGEDIELIKKNKILGLDFPKFNESFSWITS